MSFTSPSLRALSLSALIFLSTYTTYICSFPPNPTPYDSKSPDAVKRYVSPRAIRFRRYFSLSFSISHILLVLSYPSPPFLFCPNRDNLSPFLFTWTPYSVLCISAILLGCYIRFTAYAALGTNFTFRLAAPKQLITSGPYSYIQHPSYTGKTLIVFGWGLLSQRPDAVLGCWLPAWAVNATWFWRAILVFMLQSVSRVMRIRVREEENMMRETFGEEWEAWHKKTKRFIPGVY